MNEHGGELKMRWEANPISREQVVQPVHGIQGAQFDTWKRSNKIAAFWINSKFIKRRAKRREKNRVPSGSLPSELLTIM